MQLISKFIKRFRFSLCVIDIFSKYAWVAPLKCKKVENIVNAFKSILKDSNRKPNKIWVGKGSQFYNNSFKKWLQDNDIVMNSTNNEGKSVIVERLIRTLENEIYKYMTLRRSILVLGKYFIQGIDSTTIYAGKMYSTNFNVANKKICLSLHFIVIVLIYLSMAKKVLILKPKILKDFHIHCV